MPPRIVPKILIYEPSVLTTVGPDVTFATSFLPQRSNTRFSPTTGPVVIRGGNVLLAPQGRARTAWEAQLLMRTFPCLATYPEKYSTPFQSRASYQTIEYGPNLA